MQCTSRIGGGGGSPLKYGPQNCLFWGNFATTSPVKREYLGNKTRYKKTEKFNSEFCSIFFQNLVNFGAQTEDKHIAMRTEGKWYSYAQTPTLWPHDSHYSA